jgi:hypothetical protein
MRNVCVLGFLLMAALSGFGQTTASDAPGLQKDPRAVFAAAACLEAFFVVETLLLQPLFAIEALPLLALRSFPPSDNHHKVSLPFIE